MTPVNTRRRRLRTNFDTCTMLVPKTCSQPVFRAANKRWYLRQNRVRSIIYNITMLGMDRPTALARPRLNRRRALPLKGVIPSAKVLASPAFYPRPGAALMRAAPILADRRERIAQQNNCVNLIDAGARSHAHRRTLATTHGQTGSVMRIFGHQIGAQRVYVTALSEPGIVVQSSVSPALAACRAFWRNRLGTVRTKRSYAGPLHPEECAYFEFQKLDFGLITPRGFLTACDARRRDRRRCDLSNPQAENISPISSENSSRQFSTLSVERETFAGSAGDDRRKQMIVQTAGELIALLQTVPAETPVVLHTGPTHDLLPPAVSINEIAGEDPRIIIDCQ